jgi:hypothetical protein
VGATAQTSLLREARLSCSRPAATTARTRPWPTSPNPSSRRCSRRPTATRSTASAASSTPPGCGWPCWSWRPRSGCSPGARPAATSPASGRGRLRGRPAGRAVPAPGPARPALVRRPGRRRVGQDPHLALSWSAAARSGHEDVSEREAERLLLERFRQIAGDLGAPTWSRSPTSTTSSARAAPVRGLPLEERRQLYRRERIGGQQAWYARAAQRNERRATQWSLVLTTCEASGWPARS